MSKSDLERSFEYYARIAKLPAWECEFVFHPTRKWRFDVCWPEVLFYVELEGGVYSGGRHVRGSGYTKDCEKYNAAVMLSWTGLRFTTEMLKKDPMGCMEQIKRVLIARQECEQRSTVATSKRVTSKDPAASKEVGSS